MSLTAHATEITLFKFFRKTHKVDVVCRADQPKKSSASDVPNEFAADSLKLGSTETMLGSDEFKP